MRSRSGAACSAGGCVSAAGRSKKTAHAREQERPDVLKRRADWFDAQPDLDPEQLVFIDETSLSTKMARMQGHARAENDPARACRMDIGKPPPSLEPCARPA